MGLYDDDDDDDNVVQQSSASSSAQSLKREHQDDADAPKSKKAAVEASTSAADAEPAPVSSSSTLPKSPQLPPLLHAASAKKGERDDMQDAHLCLQRILAHRTDLDGRVNGILEVSRSIGDGPFKTYGVTSKPDIKKLTITPRDKLAARSDNRLCPRFVIVACDGLWKVFSNEEAAKFVWKGLEKRSKSVLEADSTAWDAVVDELVAEAIRRKCGDNVSAILIRLAPVS